MENFNILSATVSVMVKGIYLTGYLYENAIKIDKLLSLALQNGENSLLCKDAISHHFTLYAKFVLNKQILSHNWCDLSIY